MNEVKQIVGTLEKKEEGDGFINAIVNVGTKFPLKLKAWTKVFGTDIPADIVAELEGVKPGMKVSATYSEKPYKNRAGQDVTGRNLMSIAIATDNTPIKPPEKAPYSADANKVGTPPHMADGQTAPKAREYETIEERRNGMAWMNAFNNASLLYAPIMFEDYKTKGLPPEEIDRHGGNVSALAGFLHDELEAALKGQK